MTYDLLPENNWEPDFEALQRMDLRGVKMMWMNYPSMPTGKAASPELYRKAVKFALEHEILLVNDNPYSFILTDKPLSIFSVPRSKECCIELNSLSKAHNMSGWRIGMVAGDAELISSVLKVKSQMDSGMFKPMQMAAVAALSEGEEWFEQLNKGYRERRKVAGRIMEMLDAVNIVLNVNFGATSLLREDLINKKLVTTIGAYAYIERDYLIIQVVSKTKYPSKVLPILKDKLLNLEIITSDIKRKKNSEIANLVLGYEDVESVNDYLSYTLSKFNKIWDNEKEIIENMTTEKIKEIISKVSFEEISTLIVEPKKTEDK